MKIFGKHVFPRQIVLFSSGLLFLAATTYDVHRSIKNNQTPLRRNSSKTSKTTSNPSADPLKRFFSSDPALDSAGDSIRGCQSFGGFRVLGEFAPKSSSQFTEILLALLSSGSPMHTCPG